MAFSCCGRFSNKQLLNTVGRLPSILGSVNYAQAAAGAPKITFKAYEVPKDEHHDLKNERLNRPLSPHLSIYQKQLTSGLSISHRGTGIMLTGYAMALGIGALVLPVDVSTCLSIIEGWNLSASTLFLGKSAIAFPFAFHLANGIRHLWWDTGKGLSIKEVYTSGYTVMALSLVLTFAMAAL